MRAFTLPILVEPFIILRGAITYLYFCAFKERKINVFVDREPHHLFAGLPPSPYSIIPTLFHICLVDLVPTALRLRWPPNPHHLLNPRWPSFDLTWQSSWRFMRDQLAFPTLLCSLSVATLVTLHTQTSLSFTPLVTPALSMN